MSETTGGQSALSEFVQDADEEEEFQVEINYDILNQVSRQLYTNPRRAIEELVCNSYDAVATECHVNTPENGDDNLQVLDNGISMDEDRMINLWDVAGGPKKGKAEKGLPRELKGRKQIGRFGVGKLAAFSLGNELTHIATRDGTTRVISIKRDQIEGKDVTNPPQATIYKKPTSQAKKDLAEYFEGLPKPWEKNSEQWDSWTLAIVDDVEEQNTGRDLRAEFLDRMIRTAIPRNADFEAHRNGQSIGTRDYPDEKYASVDIVEEDEFETELESKLQEFWSEWDGEITVGEQIGDEEINMDTLREGVITGDDIGEESDVPEELYTIGHTNVQPNDASNEELDGADEEAEEIDALDVPILGPVTGHGTIYKESLKGGKAEDDRNLSDYGYRVRVRGKLLNRGSPRFDTAAKPHRYWNRFVGEIEAPELDDKILVQRDDIREGIKAEVAREVLDKLFYFLRNRAEFEEEQEYEPDEFGHHLHRVSPDLAPRALQGLFDDVDEVPPHGWDDISIKFEDFGHSGDIARFDQSENTIFVNEQHDFFQALETEDVPERIQKSFREAVIGPLAMSGLLRTHHVDEDVIEEGRKLTEQTFKTAARYVENPYERLCDKIETKSYEGDTPFEKAVVEALDYIGLTVEHEGGSGDSDAIVEISHPGEENLRLSIEAKGKKKYESVSHSEINLSTASGHSTRDNCDHIVAIARDFQTTPQPGDDETQLATQLKLDKNSDITILTVSALQQLLRNHQETAYSYEQLEKVLTHQRMPAECEDVVNEHWEELSVEKDVLRSIIEAAWEQQESESRVDPSIRMIYVHEKVADLDIDEHTVESVLHAVEAQAGLVTVDKNNEDYVIMQHPDEIVDVMF